MTEPDIVPAGIPHAASLAAIHAASFSPPDAWGAEAMALQLALPGAFGFIDSAGGMVLARTAAGEAEILTLAVRPERRRRGTGRALLEAAMREAASRGAGEMFLEVALRNAGARALYLAVGFAEMGVRRRYYSDGTDALVLRAPLTACGS